MEGWRIKLVLVGGLLASGGIAVLVKDIKYQLNGVAASAKVLELKSECYVSRFQAAENKWSHEPIDCKVEPELKQAFGSDKNVQVVRQDTATIEFPLRDGSLFKTEVGQQPYTRRDALHPGDTVRVIYDPQSPRNARAPLGLLDVSVSLAIFALGAASVLFGFKFNVRRESGSGSDVKPAIVSARASNPQPVREERVAFTADGASRSSRPGFGRR
jgi:hypothetical protein